MRKIPCGVLILPALLALPFCSHAQTVYFYAGGETTTLSEWQAGRGGNCYQMSPEGTSTLCNPTQAQAHSGSWAFKLDLPNPAANNGVKLIRWDYVGDQGIQLGQTLYFSSWYYIGAGFGMSTPQWTNIMQWKTDKPMNGEFANTLFLGIRYSGEVHQIYVDHWACHVAQAVPCVTFAGSNGRGGIYTQLSPKPLPFQRWFHLEAGYTAARQNGRLTVWQDGVQIFDISSPSFNTFDSYSTTHRSLQFGIGNYLDPSITGHQLLYADDIRITDYRVFTP